jgi:hypothetical protein
MEMIVNDFDYPNCVSLWRYVLLVGLRDMKRAKKQEDRRELEYFFFKSFWFNEVCEMAEVDPEDFREGLRGLMANGWKIKKIGRRAK